MYDPSHVSVFLAHPRDAITNQGLPPLRQIRYPGGVHDEKVKKVEKLITKNEIAIFYFCPSLLISALFCWNRGASPWPKHYPARNKQALVEAPTKL